MPNPESRPASGPVANLLKLLDIEQLDLNLFRGESSRTGWNRVFGGQVIAQALTAAARTVAPDRSAHSLHGYFLLAGDPAVPIIYEVDRIRDGKSFTTRRVVAIQHGRAIFSMSISFQVEEEGFAHQAPMPDVPGPESFPSDDSIDETQAASLPEPLRTYYRRERPIEMRPVESDRGTPRPGGHMWMRARKRLPDDPTLHQAMLAYASDLSLLDTAMMPLGKTIFDESVQAASLDHALWLHRPFRIDEWLLYAKDSPNASGARGFARGAFYTQDGTLVASVAQEGLMRRKR